MADEIKLLLITKSGDSLNIESIDSKITEGELIEILADVLASVLANSPLEEWARISLLAGIAKLVTPELAQIIDGCAISNDDEEEVH